MSDLKDFKPCVEYYLLLINSVKRKTELNLHNLTYKQLSRTKEIITSDYELHHIIPRYRLKNHKTSFLNQPDNIAILTPREHLLAHYYLCISETGKAKQSARVAFLMLFNLKKLSFSEIEGLSEDELENLIKASVEAHANYFGSDKHREGSSKAGKIAGAKRKERFENDPAFREYMLSKLKQTPEQKEKTRLKIKLKHENTPPLKINSPTKEYSKPSKYKKQLWEYFDSIYIGCVKYRFSYKLIAKILEIDYRRISGIVRGIQSVLDLPEDFKQYKYYDAFYLEYPGSLNDNIIQTYEYYSESTPWNKHYKNDGWLFFDKLLEMDVGELNPHKLSKQLDIAWPQANDILLELNTVSSRNILDWKYYKNWLFFKQIKEKENSGIKTTT